MARLQSSALAAALIAAASAYPAQAQHQIPADAVTEHGVVEGEIPHGTDSRRDRFIEAISTEAAEQSRQTYQGAIRYLEPDEELALLDLFERLGDKQAGILFNQTIAPEPTNIKQLVQLYQPMGERGRTVFAQIFDRMPYGNARALGAILAERPDLDFLRFLILSRQPEEFCVLPELRPPSADIPPNAPYGPQDCTMAMQQFLSDWNQLTGYMINARPTEFEKVPWQAQLMRTGQDAASYRPAPQVMAAMEQRGMTFEDWQRDHICGAVNIGGGFVLTAAHCVTGWDGFAGEFLRDRRIRTGVTYLNEQGQKHAIRSVVIHSGFVDGSTQAGSDIALIKLAAAPARPSREVRPASSPNGGLPEGIQLTASGWGFTGATKNTGGVFDRAGRVQMTSLALMSGTLNYYPDSICNEHYAYKRRGIKVQPGQICVGSVKGVDACRGDSGGPLVLEGGRPRLIGLVSWGLGCGLIGFPTIFTDVGYYAQWIADAKALANRSDGQIVRLGDRN